MTKTNNEDEGLKWEHFPVYPEAELDDFAKWLETFRVKHTVVIDKKVVEKKMMMHPILKKMEMREIHRIDRTPRDVSYVDEREAAVAFGAMRKTIHLGKPHYAVIMQQVEKATGKHAAKWAYPSKYDIFQDKLKQLERLRWSRGRREEKKVEGLEELARGMDV